MSYIAPNTTVAVCKGVPLDPSYKNTIYWSSTSSGSSAGLAQQQEYFASMVKYQYDYLTYQRVGKGKIRVEQCADDLYDCNYLYFRNTAFGDKYFYAFITGVEYINNITSEITYEIDVMQTWFFSYELGYCFVEREHVDDDTIGAHVIEEEINYGDVKCVDVETTGLFTAYKAMVATAYDTDTGSSVVGGVYSGIPSGLHYSSFDCDISSDMDTLLNWLAAMTDANKSESVVSIWMQPSEFSDTDSISNNTHYITVEMPSTINGYSPRNNKLFVYPYNVLSVDCGNDTSTYRYEWFGSDGVESAGGYRFQLIGTVTPDPEIVCTPLAYNCDMTGSDSRNPYNYSESIIMRGFPQIAWTIDTYSQWVASGGLAKNYLQTLTASAMLSSGIAGEIGSFGGSSLSTNVEPSNGLYINTRAVTRGISQAGGALIERQNMATKGGTGHGMQGSDVMVASRNKDFYFKCMQIPYEYARTIDNYFTMFGYRVNRVKQPNLTSREKWNYVKTAGCTILPTSVPADDVARIESIYDNGITFWHSPSYIGHYNLTNPIA